MSETTIQGAIYFCNNQPHILTLHIGLHCQNWHTESEKWIFRCKGMDLHYASIECACVLLKRAPPIDLRNVGDGSSSVFDSVLAVKTQQRLVSRLQQWLVQL